MTSLGVGWLGPWLPWGLGGLVGATALPPSTCGSSHASAIPTKGPTTCGENFLSAIFADTVFVNGRFATLAAGQPEVEALAAHRGRILALGTNREIEALAGPGTARVDLGGRRVIPGIVESHAHPDSYGIKLTKHHLLAPERFATIEAVLDYVSEVTKEAPADAWFVGYRYNDQKQGGWPTLEQLDRASHGRPLFVWRTDHHVGFVNSRAMQLAGIGPDTPNPPFGHIDRDAAGKPTGLLRETAMAPFTGLLDADDTVTDYAEGLVKVFEEFAKVGITSVVNSLASSKAIRAYQRLRDAGELRLRVGLLISGREPGLIESYIQAGIRSGFGDEWIRVIGVEWCPDCSTSGRTAAYYEPYVGQPALGEPRPNTGILLYDQDDLTQRVIAAHAAGLQVCLDGVGDRGIDFCLDCLEAALDAHPKDDHRLRVEHCCYVTPPVLERLARTGIVDSSATGFMYSLGDAYIANRGQAAMRHMWPHRTLIDRGLKAPGHSDAPVCSSNPFLAIHAMVNRRTDTGGDLAASEAMTVEEAIRAYTELGAWVGREEHDKGTLAPGKLADFAVLDRDPFTIDPLSLAEVQVDMTVVGGTPVHTR
ncbi:MAG: amidohydrolase [Geminicoccaceae bacterium]|nr:MAG: amidohydrolase [Geminicoccaceae bacterium]